MYWKRKRLKVPKILNRLFYGMCCYIANSRGNVAIPETFVMVLEQSQGAAHVKAKSLENAEIATRHDEIHPPCLFKNNFQGIPFCLKYQFHSCNFMLPNYYWNFKV